jgi:hypothetical protein
MSFPILSELSGKVPVRLYSQAVCSFLLHAGPPPAEATCNFPYEVFAVSGGVGSMELHDIDICESSNSYQQQYNYDYISDYVLHISEQPFARVVTMSAEPNTTGYAPVLVATTECNTNAYSGNEVSFSEGSLCLLNLNLTYSAFVYDGKGSHIIA